MQQKTKVEMLKINFKSWTKHKSMGGLFDDTVIQIKICKYYTTK